MTDKDDFLKKCHEKKPKGSKEAIERGRLKWFVGKPAAAEDGFGALAVSDSLTITFDESDVRVAEKAGKGGLYRVGLDPSAHVLVTESRVVELSPCDCGGDPNDPGPGRVAYRYDLNKVAGFEIEPDFSVNSPGIPGYVDPCVKAGRSAFDNCMRWPGTSVPMCGAISVAAEAGCRNQFF